MAKMNWDGAQRRQTVAQRGGSPVWADGKSPLPKESKCARLQGRRDLLLRALTMAKAYGHSPNRIRMLERQLAMVQEKLDRLDMVKGEKGH